MASVGKNIPHDSAKTHVSGESVFVDDILSAKNELVVDFFPSPVAHGKIRNLDISPALKIDGVAAVYTYKDIPGRNDFGPIIQDEKFMAETSVHFIGEPVAVIAAENKRALKKAKSAIKLEIDELSAILTIEDAIKNKSFIAQKREIKRGDLNTAFKNAEHILEGVFRTGAQEHFYLESGASIAYPDEAGQLMVLSSTQNPTEIQGMVANALGLGQHQLVCKCKRMGGGFGGKETQGTHPALAVSLVAFKTGRQARFSYSKDDDMKFTGKRHPVRSDYKAAFTSEGVITAYHVDFYSDAGAAADLSTSILERTMLHADNAYYLPNVHITGTLCRTNFPPNTAFRGFGAPQGVACIENIIEEIALFLKKDSYEIRMMNCYGKKSRNIAPYGQTIHNNVLPDIFKKLHNQSKYASRVESIKKFNQTSPTHLKGISMTPIKFGISFTTKHLNQGSALVNVYTDGTVQVSTGGTEMGQGLNTKIKQIVAGEFDIDPEDVITRETSTEKNNNAAPTSASAGTDLNGWAAVDACRKIRSNLADCAAHYFSDPERGIDPSPENILFKNGFVFDHRLPEEKISFKDLTLLAWKERYSIGERGFYVTPGVNYNRDTGKGNPFLYYTNGCAVSEVLIDRLTGETSVKQVDILMDLGKSINPGIDRGQIIGAFIQGMGWTTSEEIVYSEKGELLSHSPTTYKIPNIQDFPEKFHLDFFDNKEFKINIARSKGIGEPPFLLGISVWTAIKNALSHVPGTRLNKLKIPATIEEIVMCLSEVDDTSSPDKKPPQKKKGKKAAVIR
jgi:xanthine dehydrogenase large subunit